MIDIRSFVDIDRR